MTRPFIIDTDTASDDAVALIMALRADDVDVKAITTVAGNVPVQMGARNALITAELCGADVPIYVGAHQPLVRPYADAEWFHGQDGLGDQGYADPEGEPQPEHAVEALIETIKANPGIVLVTLGPLTNIAMAVQRAPEIVKNVSRCVVMGGAACTYGNVTPAAEYNIWCDPDAAQITFLSGLPVEMVGWEFCQGQYALSLAEMDSIRSMKTPYADFALDCNATALEAYHTQTGETALALPDPVAMAVALDPSIATFGQHYVMVETDSDLTRGMTVVDRLGVAEDARNRDTWGDAVRGQTRISVCWDLDAAGWKHLLYKALN